MKFDTGLMNQTITATALSTAVAIMIAIAGQGTLVPGIGADVNFSRLDHADGRQHRVDRKHQVEQQDLSDHVGDADLRRRSWPSFVVVQLAFEAAVNFPRGLGQQEQAAGDQDQVADREVPLADREELRLRRA